MSSPVIKLRFLSAALSDLGHGLAFTVLVDLVAYRHNGATGQCNPSYGMIAKDVHATVRGVKMAIKRLERDGWLRRSVGGQGRGDRNHYSLAWERLEAKKGEPSSTLKEEKGEQNDMKRVNKTTKKGEIVFEPPHQSQALAAVTSERTSERTSEIYIKVESEGKEAKQQVRRSVSFSISNSSSSLPPHPPISARPPAPPEPGLAAALERLSNGVRGGLTAGSSDVTNAMRWRQ